MRLIRNSVSCEISYRVIRHVQRALHGISELGGEKLTKPFYDVRIREDRDRIMHAGYVVHPRDEGVGWHGRLRGREFGDVVAQRP